MVKLILSRLYYGRLTWLRCFSAKPKVILDETISTLLSNKEVVHRNHPGIIKPRTTEFPKWALKAIHDVLKEKQIVLRDVNESAKKLVLYLNGRHSPVEESELQTKLSKIEERLNAHNSGQKISIRDVNFHQNAKARNIFKQHVYNWQPVNFDKLTCLTYLVGRSVQNYAVAYRILNEIKARDNDFKPKTLFDFGSGVGTVMWAASQIWPDSLKEYLCIEISKSMIELSEKLAKVAQPTLKKIFYRQYFPSSVNPSYDIVVSAYSLFELPNMQTRLDTILKLWRKTEHYLIVIEEGTNAGFKLVNEARDFILKYTKSKWRQGSSQVHVFSPCPHDLTCPRFATDNTPCNFAVLYHPLQFLGGKKHKAEQYSYVVLKKDERPENDEQWPRIVRATLNRSKHTICRMCVANGELKEEIFTDYKHGRHMYRCAKNSKWGDRLPMFYSKEQENLERDDTTNGAIPVE